MLNNCVGLYLHSAKQIIFKFSFVKKFTNLVWVKILPVHRAGSRFSHTLLSVRKIRFLRRVKK